ncbi:MAG: hypothetical protein RMX96_22780 [Nostoc sp. ChiSLP02]|nr:hypothetical protein [Nostoc sp. DedSLP05]MDZ8099943.1 hypothetical protein [Nostoc sp. DedSLP01]MDZ8187662.1 hypothetical protein [Nostoc sp. ChiSLP02]
MSFPSCSSCVVILNQQQEQNISHQKQCQDVPVKHSTNTAENCTVVENGRVVVKPSQPPVNETSE